MTRESRHLVLLGQPSQRVRAVATDLFPNRPPRRRPAFHLRPRPSAR